MKLKTPIVVTIESVECATMFCEIMNLPQSLFSQRIRNLATLCKVTNGKGICSQAENQLTAQGIDYRTWEPPQPLLIASHPVTANPDGSIKVGCTDVTRLELEAAHKLSTEAMQQEAEWPKYYHNLSREVIRFDSESHTGLWVKEGKKGYFGNHSHCVTHPDMTPLTPLEAKAILEGKS